MSGVYLTTKELDNIKITYQHYGAEKLDEFIQAIWKEAYSEGYEKALMQIKHNIVPKGEKHDLL